MTGNYTDETIGRLDVTIYGGTESQRAELLNALRADLTGTARGREILDLMVNGPGAGAPLTPRYDVLILEGTGIGTFTYLSERFTVFDPSDLTLYYEAAPGGALCTPDRIFAHELGHLAGASDKINPMENIDLNENRIMRQRGNPFDRTRLELPEWQY